ncbi:MAG: DnaD domain-containing protein [Chloroflexota bacterium]
MTDFKGFTDSETFTRLPDSFIRLLGEIESLAELKVTLYAIWRIEHLDGPFRALCQTDFTEAGPLSGMEAGAIASGLDKAVSRGTLVRAAHGSDVFYFLNSPRGRAAAESFSKGDWRASARIMQGEPPERPNVFRLYEENIGPLTPLIADTLKDAESEYSAEWIEEALAIAVKNNKRNWRYVEAILKRWKEENRAQKQDRRDAQEGGRRYTEGEFAEYLRRDPDDAG